MLYLQKPFREPHKPLEPEYKFGEPRNYGGRPALHNGEDWNGVKGGNTDCGYLLYGISLERNLVTDILETSGGFGKAVQTLIQGPWGFRWIEYDHCEEILVQVGQEVDGNTPIARMGSTGNSSHCHLHWVVRNHGHLFRAIVRDQATLNQYYEAPSAFLAQWMGEPSIPAPPSDDLMKLIQRNQDDIAKLRGDLRAVQDLQAQHDRMIKEHQAKAVKFGDTVKIETR